MAQPTAYTRYTSFKSYQTLNPSTPLPGQSVDIEFNRVKTTLDELLANIALIQRDDGRIANGSIGLAQLESTLLAFNIDRPTSWTTGTAYAVDQTVFQNSNLYICLVAHTSGTFSTDLAASKWELIGDFSAIVSAAEDAADAAASSASTASAAATAASAAAATAEDAASVAGTGQLDWFGNLAGTNTYTCTNSTGYAPANWTNGYKVRARVVNANSGASTLNPNSWGAKSIVLPDGSSLSGGELIAGSVAEFTYVSSLDKVVLGGLALVDDGVTTAKVADEAITNAKLTNMAQATVKGRASGAGTGAPTDLSAAQLYAIIASQITVFSSGMVMPFAGTSAPSGWLFAYGQAVSRTTYADLFTAIGTTYGAGDGSTTFNLPDLRGRVVAGKDDMGGSSANRLTDQSGGLDGDVLGDTGGSETHTLTVDELAEHDHLTPFKSSGAGGVTSVVSINGNSPGTIRTEVAGADQAHNNVQPTIILNYIIKT